MGTARLFLAFDLAVELRSALATCARTLRPALTQVRWVRPEALHLTLVFLGDTPEERLEALTAAVSQTLAAQVAMPCEVRGLGVFPDLRRPLVVWAGVTTGGSAVRHLVERLQSSLKEAGFAVDDRPFAAHVTIGRLRPRQGRADSAALQAALGRWSETHFGELAGDRVILYASTLTPAGPLYEARRVWPLRDSLPRA